MALMAMNKRTTVDSFFVSVGKKNNRFQDVRNSMTTRIVYVSVKLFAAPKTMQPLNPGYGGSATFFLTKKRE
jgi:hypothetical protein